MKFVHFRRRIVAKSNRDLQRLKDDESYLETLAHIFSNTGGKEKPLFSSGGGYGKSTKTLEESGWDLSKFQFVDMQLTIIFY